MKDRPDPETIRKAASEIQSRGGFRPPSGMEEWPSSDDLVWITLRDERENVVGSVGLAPGLLVGRSRHIDGWSTNEVVPPMQFAGRPVHGMPFVLLHVPDYQTDDAMTYVLSSRDAKLIGQQLIESSQRAERVLKHEMKQLLDTAQKINAREHAASAREAMRCAFANCRRERKFFDGSGKGYCKRHAEQLGIRPRGKV